MAIKIRKRIRTRIQRDTRPYHEQKGWRRCGWLKEKLVGTYRAKWWSSWEGKIVDGRYYILEPPPELEHSGHWACFSHVGKGWYHIHFVQKPKSFDDGILSVEKILREALEMARGHKQ